MVKPIGNMLRYAFDLERRFLGIGGIIPASYRRRVRKALGVQPAPSPRRYIPAELGVRGFFAQLQERNVRYAVLRWFDILPVVDPGEDIDLLVADEDLSRLAELLDDEAGTVPCDVYTVSGQPGTAYRGMPYLPPSRARDLLAGARKVNDLVMVPSPEAHFLSLAYHAVYQKGLAAGLPTAQPHLTPSASPEHDYGSVLASLARDLGIEVRIDLEDLDRLLSERGWRPLPEMMSKLAANNAWMRHLAS